MSWTPVNADLTPIFEDASFDELVASAPTPSTLSIASQHRINILAAAETLTRNLPKRRKTSAQPSRITKKDVKSLPSKAKSKSASEKSSTSVRCRSASKRNTKAPRTEFSIEPAKADQALDNLKNLQPISREQQNVTLESIVNDEEGKITENGEHHLPASCEIIDISSDDTIGADSAGSTKATNSTTTPATPIVIETSSDDGINFDDFDFCEADLEQYTTFEPLHASTTNPSNFPVTPKRSSECQTKLSSAQRACDITAHSKPNGAPFAPFMNPSSLSLASTLLADTGSHLEHNFTCFRAGELLQLSRKLRTLEAGNGQCVRIEFFATIREVRFANNMGYGQDIVFGDIFFPDQPPFVTTVSKTPYSARDLLVNRISGKPKGLVKAAVVYDPAIVRNCSQADGRSPALSIGVNRKTTETTAILEAVEIQHSSWEEVSEVRSMIERDVRARNASTRTESQAYLLDPVAIEQLTTNYELSDLEE